MLRSRRPLRTFAPLSSLCLAALVAGGCSDGMDAEPGPQPDMFAAAQKEAPLLLTLSRTNDTLRIEARDGATPVMTDLWLFQAIGGTLVPFGDFTDPASKRRSRRLMMPCTIDGKPSGLTPCSETAENGLMSDAVRATRSGTDLASAIDGTVEVKLTKVPTDTLVVVAALEDQRYRGAAALSPGGQPAELPAGVPDPDKRAPRTYAKDVAPILAQRCTGCHSAGSVAGDFPLTSYEEVVNLDFGYGEELRACAAKFPTPMDEAMRLACEKAIAKVEFFLEPGAPALSPIARRTRPDELRAASPEGLKWFGSGSLRFGSHGDRRMPPTNITPETTDDKPEPTYFDQNPADFQILFDWIAQGAPR